MQILLVRQEKMFSDKFVKLAESENMNCQIIENADDALYAARTMDIDLIVSEINLPDMSGLEFLRKLRLARIATPFVFLTNLPDNRLNANEVKAYQLGANDYIQQPFNPNVICLKLKSIVMNSKGHHSRVINIGDLKIDISKSEVTYLEQRIKLSPKQFLILETLALSKGRVVSQERLLNRMYNHGDDIPGSNVIGVYISHIREKIQFHSGANYIQTEHGQGYRLSVPA